MKKKVEIDSFSVIFQFSEMKKVDSFRFYHYARNWLKMTLNDLEMTLDDLEWPFNLYHQLRQEKFFKNGQFPLSNYESLENI